MKLVSGLDEASDGSTFVNTTWKDSEITLASFKGMNWEEFMK